MSASRRPTALPSSGGWRYLIGVNLAVAIPEADLESWVHMKIYLAGPLGFSEAGRDFHDCRLIPELEQAGHTGWIPGS
jgi:hypothetical protein